MTAENTLKKRLSLAFLNLTEIEEDIVKRHGPTLEELDLSHNNIYFRFLMEFPRLTTLILDHNHIESHVKFPTIANLHTLWVNHNDITNLGVIIKTFSTCFPNLRYLSLMNNPAAPSYFNGGTLIQYTDYRQYVISQFSKLTALDDQQVTKDDRREAERIYGKSTSEGAALAEKKAQRRASSSANQSITNSRRRSSVRPNDGTSKSKSKKSHKKLFDD